MTEKLKILLLVPFVAIFLSACGSVENYTVQKEEVATLVFKGDLSNVFVETAEFPRFNLIEKTGAKSNAESAEVIVKPGNHQVKVFRGSQLLINRKIFLSNNDNREILVP